MRHRVREFKVGRRSSHVQAMLANQVSSLILEGRIRTTVVKAKETRRLAEKMITLGKKGSLHDRRRAISKIGNKEAVKKLFAEVAPQFMERAGGYTRIIRLGFRRGDAAEMCFLELVQEAVGNKAKTKEEPKAEKTAPEADAPEVIESEAGETEAVAEEDASTEEAEATASAEEASDESAEDVEKEKAE